MLKISKNWFLLVVSVIVWLGGCRQSSDPANTNVEEVMVTDIAMVEGTPQVVTRIVQEIVEIPVTAIPVEIDRPSLEDPTTLDISFQNDFPRLDPQKVNNQEAINLVQNLFAGLTRFNLLKNSIEPELATRWEISPDGLVWTFHLRDDIYWMRVTEDGAIEQLRPVNAKDVVLAFQRACDPRVETPSIFVLYIIQGCEAVSRSLSVNDADLSIVGVSSVDDTTVTFRLTEPANQFLAMTTLWWLRPVPAEMLAIHEEEWDLPENLVTSGVFLLRSGSENSALTILERNPTWPIVHENYENGNIDMVRISHVELTTAFEMWQARELELAPLPRSAEAVAFADTAARYRLIPEQRVFYLSYNFESDVFRHPEVRRAFGAAVDRERLIIEVYGGRGLPMRHFAPEGVFGAPRFDEVGTGYNPDYARRQLAASPFTDCRLMTPIRYMVSSSDLSLQHAEEIRQMWLEELSCPEDVIRIEQVPFGQLVANTLPDAPNRPDVWDLGWASYYPDQQNWVGDILHCTLGENRSLRPCSDVDLLIEQAAKTIPQDNRWQPYYEVERAFFGENGIEPFTPLLVLGQYRVEHRWVSYQPAYFGGEQYDQYVINILQKDLETTP